VDCGLCIGLTSGARIAEMVDLLSPRDSHKTCDPKQGVCILCKICRQINRVSGNEPLRKNRRVY
jgi:hypothetical protein